jgi:hypothetical protein
MSDAPKPADGEPQSRFDEDPILKEWLSSVRDQRRTKFKRHALLATILIGAAAALISFLPSTLLIAASAVVLVGSLLALTNFIQEKVRAHAAVALIAGIVSASACAYVFSLFEWNVFLYYFVGTATLVLLVTLLLGSYALAVDGPPDVELISVLVITAAAAAAGVTYIAGRSALPYALALCFGIPIVAGIGSAFLLRAQARLRQGSRPYRPSNDGPEQRSSSVYIRDLTSIEPIDVSARPMMSLAAAVIGLGSIGGIVLHFSLELAPPASTQTAWIGTVLFVIPGVFVVGVFVARAAYCANFARKLDREARHVAERIQAVEWESPIAFSRSPSSNRSLFKAYDQFTDPGF